ncbi:MAG: hypothetical protein WCD35_13900, partial [Mycobacteriales bacterium]
MRTLMKISIPVQRGNEAMRSGALPKTMQYVIDRIHPETAFFTLEDGRRTGYMVFDMTESHDMPPIIEPLFLDLDADVELTPCM